MKNKAKKPYETAKFKLISFAMGDVVMASNFDNEGFDTLWPTEL